MQKRAGAGPPGFTLVELLVVVVIIGILAAIALPNFISAQVKAKESSVKANMRTAQIAAESYCVGCGGAYPFSVNAGYESYFPGGGNDLTTPGSKLTNPFFNTTGFPNNSSTCTSPTSVGSTRSAAPPSVSTSGCGVDYCAITTPWGYAILGATSAGKGVTATGPSTTLVLSNM
jgi:prepilin-type N-terminal cleavage/methylation domain-containing protein